MADRIKRREKEKWMWGGEGRDRPQRENKRNNVNK